MNNKLKATHGNDVAATKCMQHVNSILENQYDGWQQDFIRRSFYLPMQVLKDGRWKVEPILVVSGKEFTAGLCHQLSTETVTLEGCNRAMLSNAQWVGISVRTELATKKVFVVCKIWYGKGA